MFHSSPMSYGAPETRPVIGIQIMEGDSVYYISQLLYKLGYITKEDIEVPGTDPSIDLNQYRWDYYGPPIRKAVARFQTDKGLRPSGNITIDTWEALDNASKLHQLDYILGAEAQAAQQHIDDVEKESNRPKWVQEIRSHLTGMGTVDPRADPILKIKAGWERLQTASWFYPALGGVTLSAFLLYTMWSRKK
jgi:peptidoglycan hydrolase-like protein with peptidoglycan-binding domain